MKKQKIKKENGVGFLKKEKKMEKKLKKRDKEILLFLYKFRVSEIKTIQEFLGFKNYIYVTEILKELYDNGFLIRYRRDIYDPYKYSLSYKSLRFFGKESSKEYDFFSLQINTHLLHSELVVFFLRDNKNITLNNLISQREMLSYYHRLYDGFYHYKLPIFIYEDRHIFFDFITSKSYEVNTYILKLKDVIHYQNPKEFIIFNNVFNDNELSEIKKSVNKDIYFYSLDYINTENDFSLNTLRSD